eukprot:COSAG02_NODE_4801_length_4960_cov_3.266406_8_plen_98_part_00
MGSTPDPVPDLISLSQAGSRFDFEPPPKASEMQPSLSSHALKQLLKLARVLERLFFFITLPALAPARVRQGQPPVRPLWSWLLPNFNLSWVCSSSAR